MPVPAGFFPLGKPNFLVFFTVKHVFLKIKWWPARAGPIKEGKHEKA
jgi:hypothetical protein